MARLIWTEPALQDLDEIADYIALDNTGAAKQLVQDVFSKVKRLKKHPKLGKPVPELGESIYRELFVTACRIFYRVEEVFEKPGEVSSAREIQRGPAMSKYPANIPL